MNTASLRCWLKRGSTARSRRSRPRECPVGSTSFLSVRQAAADFTVSVAAFYDNVIIIDRSPA